VASATSLTRDEFVAQQSGEALALRAGILNDPQAPLGLKVLATDPVAWVDLHLAALEDAGLLRPLDEAPPVRESPLVVSLLAALATGILAGPGGETILAGPGAIIDPGDPSTQPLSLLDFFAKLRQWYGHNEGLIGGNAPPPFADFDLGTSRQTHFESFEVFVPYGKARLDLPAVAPVTPVSFGSFLEGDAAGVGNLATLVGPFGFGDQQFVPVGQPLPYTVYFENASTAGGTVGEIRIVTELDGDLDPRRFRLGDLRIGDIEVKLPASRGAFAGDFDFSMQLGFILRISAGLDIPTNAATWLIQAIDPQTGDVVTNPQIGLLPPNNANGSGAGFVTYTTAPLPAATTGDVIEAQARVLFNNAPPQDTALVTHVIDAVAPQTTLTATPLGADGAHHLIQWSAVDEEAGSGVRHVTIYAAQDGGDFRIVQAQSTDTSLVFEGEPGSTYEFLALATDHAGNREQPPFGVAAPDDGSRANLGALPDVLATTTQNLGPPPPPAQEPSSNPLFLEAQAQVPAAPATNRPSEFESVLRPFVARSFATGIGQSFSDIGPMAIVPLDDGSVLVSGGLNRGSLYRLALEGGEAGDPLVTLPYPVFDMALAQDGTLWAATGGGPLLQLDPANGQIINQFGDGLTQTLAIEPQTGVIYISSGRGIEIFDPVAQTFSHFTDTRIGHMRFAPDGSLWAAIWPTRGEVVRFSPHVLPGQSGLDDQPQLMLRLDSPVDSLAFGVPGTPLEGLLWISNNSRLDGGGTGSVIGGELVIVDLATLQQVTVAANGSRGDVVVTTPDGRVLLSQSNQIDVISPRVAPRVTGFNPPDGAVVGPPLAGIDVFFDEDMFAGPADAPASVLNPDNYSITDSLGDPVRITSVGYDDATRTVSLAFDALQAEVYTLVVSASIRSDGNVPLATPLEAEWTVIVDLTAFVDLAFTNTRLSRGSEALSYDVTITNVAGFDLLIPATLLFAPGPGFGGAPAGGIPDGNGFLIDLSASLGPDGVLAAGESLDALTIAVHNEFSQRLVARHGLFALPAANEKPIFTSDPVRDAVAGQPYAYAPTVADPDEIGAFMFVLLAGPDGMTIDSTSGEVTWAPTPADPAISQVTLRVYDTRGGVRHAALRRDARRRQPRAGDRRPGGRAIVARGRGARAAAGCDGRGRRCAVLVAVRAARRRDVRPADGDVDMDARPGRRRHVRTAGRRVGRPPLGRAGDTAAGWAVARRTHADRTGFADAKRRRHDSDSVDRQRSGRRSAELQRDASRRGDAAPDNRVVPVDAAVLPGRRVRGGVQRQRRDVHYVANDDDHGAERQRAAGVRSAGHLRFAGRSVAATAAVRV
jgi:large repetitive protein